MHMMSESTQKAGQQYWMSKIAHTDSCFPARPEANAVYRSVNCELSPALVNAVRVLGKADALTELAVYLAFYGLLLRKYFSTASVLVASSAPEPGHAAGSVVFFSLATDTRKTLRQLLLDVKGDIEEVLLYQDNELEVLQTLFANNNIPLAPALEFGFTVADHQAVPSFAATLAIRIDKSAHAFELVYREDAFTEVLVRQIGESYTLLLEEGLKDLMQECGRIDFLPAALQQTLLAEAGGKGKIYKEEDTIVSHFEQIVGKFPFNTAVSIDGKTQTYEELNRLANIVAHQLLQHQDVRAQQPVGLLLGRTAWMIPAILGVLKSGAAYVPLNPDDPAERKALILRDAGVKLVISDSGLQQELPADIQVLLVPAVFEQASDSPAGNPDVSIVPADTCYIIYTSGTTGQPKGVKISHANVIQLFFNEGFPFDFDEQDCWTLFHNYNFDFSVWEIFGALFYGGKVVIVPQNVFYNTAEFIRLMTREQVTVLSQTPGVFSLLMHTILEMKVPPVLFLRYVIFGGEELKPGSLEAWATAFPHIQLINMYGITETTVHVTFKRLQQEDIVSPLSNIGQPLQPVKVFVLNEDQQLLPPGVTGELYIGGAGVAAGYVNNPTLTEARFPVLFGQRLYRSGDMGKRLENKDLVYAGRKDNQVSIRGYRVEIGEVMMAFLQHTAVKDVLILPVANQFSQMELVAFILLKEEVSLEDITTAVASRLPRYMMPSRSHILTNKPLTRNGKVDTASLVALDEKSREDRSLMQPRNVVEHELYAIWKKLLKTERISVGDDFFAIGGDSIKVIKLLNQVNQHISRVVEIQDMFEHKTIRSLADYILQTDKESGSNILRAQAELRLRKLKADVAGLPGLPAGTEDIYPMSDIEAGMIFHNIYAGSAGVYHDQFVYEFSEPAFDVAIFGKALNFMVEKHALLRTSYHMDAYSEPLQAVHPATDCFDRLLFEDIAHYDSGQQQQHIEEYMKQDRALAFDVTLPGLWRMIIFRLGTEEYLLLWVFHHAILDGWSNASFIITLTDTYHRLLADSTYRPPALAASYLDHVIDQQVAKNDMQLRQYWKDHLQGYQRLPLPFKSTEILNFNKAESRVHYSYIEGAQADRIKQFAQQLQMNIKELLFAGFLYLLRVACDQEDITIGLVSHNRPAKKDGDQVLGCFLNTVPFRIRIPDADLHVPSFLQYVREQYQRSKQHDRLSFMEIIKDVEEKGAYFNPVFDVKFDFVDFYVYGEVSEHARASRKRSQFRTYTRTNTAFDFNTSVSTDAILITITCPDNSYTAEEIDFIHDLYTAILDSFVAGDRTSYQTVMDRSGALKIIDKSNDTFMTPSVSNWLQLFDNSVRKYASLPALVFEGRKMTYHELDEQATRLAYYIANNVSDEGGRVVIALPRSDLFVISMLAVLKAGLTFIPLDITTSEERMQYILQDAQAALILTDYNGWMQLGAMYAEKILAVDIQLPVLPPPAASWKVSPDSAGPAYMIYTSGSTGHPKGTLIRHSSLANYISWFVSTYQITSADSTLVFSSLAFDLSFTTLLSSLAAGATLHLFPVFERFNLDTWRNYLIENEITYLKLTPSHFSMLTADPYFPDRYQQMKIRLFVTGGEKLRPKDIRSYLELFPETHFVNHYGPTETTIGVITHDITAENISYLFHNPVIGRPIHNHTVYICDGEQRILGPGQKGEICIAGAGVAIGYHQRDALTAEKFIRHHQLPDKILYRTGDSGRWLPNGLIEFYGRLDDQVKINGYRVEPGEIEAQLRSIKGIEKAVVVAVPNSMGDNELLAFLVMDAPLSDSWIREELSKRLPDYMIPHRYHMIADLPLTANGKVDKKALLVVETASVLTHHPATHASMNEVEQQVHDIWKKVLGVDMIHPDAKFFDVGGDSLKLVHLAKRLSEELSSRLEVADLFNYTSIREVARQLQHTVTAAPVTTGIEI